MLRLFFAPFSLGSIVPFLAHRTIATFADSPSFQQSDPQLPPSPYGFVKLLSGSDGSRSVATGDKYHSAILKLGFLSSVFVATALFDFYCKARIFSSALQLFNEMPHRNVVTWNALIRGFSLSSQPNLALKAFSVMHFEGISPTPYTFSTVLAALSKLEDPMVGVLIHCLGLKLGLFYNVVAGTALVDMYCKCFDMGAANSVFDDMPERNVVTWTSLLTGYAQHKRPTDAMLLVLEMRQLGIPLNKMTYNSLLSSFWMLGDDLAHGKQVHCAVIKEGLDFDPYILASLITMYSKCGSSEDFMNVCPNVPDQDNVSWNSIISGFLHLGGCWEVLVEFSKMRKACLNADIFTFASVLRAIAIASAHREGKQTHALIIKLSYDSHLSIQNGLVSMYAKCGEISDSKSIFLSMRNPDLISLNSFLSGCARHGIGKEAVEMFEEMRGVGLIKPDGVTYLSLLLACSHNGFVKKGLELFHMMKEEDPPIVPGTKHYACMVDLLGRAGCIDEACIFIESIPIKPGISVYRALLSACQAHGNVEMAEYAAKGLFELCPNDSGAHVLLSNVFAAVECWSDAAQIRNVMHCKRVRKRPAWSWIEGQGIDQQEAKLCS